MSIIRKYGPVVFALIVVIALVGGIVWGLNQIPRVVKDVKGPVVVTTTPSASASSTPSATPSMACATTWSMTAGNYGSLNRWFNDGIAAIRDAKTEVDARQAINTWLDGVKQDPVLLSGASRIFLHKEIAASDLQQDGCASPKAVDTVIDLTALMGQSSMTPSQAPTTGFNTGVLANQVVVSAAPGVYGDTKAVQITMPDGSVAWVLARCGNPVIPSNPGLPTGPTDNPKPSPTPTPTCVEIPNNGIVDCGGAKDPAAGAATRSNVPTIGQGVNPPPPAQPSAPAVTQAPTAVNTTQAPPPVVVPTTASVVPSTRTTTPPPPPPSATVTATYAPSCPNPDNPACG